MSRNQPWRDKDVLEELYYNQEMPIESVAEHLGVSPHTIHRWMKRHDMDRRHAGPISERLHTHYEKDPDSGCWVWQSATDGKGYGQVSVDGEQKRAHRASYELHNGEIPDGEMICHTCHNPSCVNPDHLYAGSAQDNMDDAKERGTIVESRARGEDQGNSKLTSQEVKEIRERYANTDVTQYELADEYGTTQTNIYDIVNRNSWKHV